MHRVTESDCVKSIYTTNVFLLYYWGGDVDCYYLAKDKENHYVEILI